MKTETTIRRKDLGSDYVLPITLEIELERHGEDGCVQREFVKCHFYQWTSDSLSGIDIFVVEGGRIVRVASYNGVLSAQEIEPEAV